MVISSDVKGDVLRLDVALQLGVGVPVLHQHQQLWWTGPDSTDLGPVGPVGLDLMCRRQISTHAFFWPSVLQPAAQDCAASTGRFGTWDSGLYVCDHANH